MFRIESCATQQILVNDLSGIRASAQIQIEQHSDFRWRRAKAWIWRLLWFWIDHNQSLQPNRSQMKCDLPQEMASAQIRIDQHSDFRWRRAKAWKRCGMILKHSQPKITGKSVANEMQCLNMWWPALTWRASIFDSKIFLAICLCKQSSAVLLTNHP